MLVSASPAAVLDVEANKDGAKVSLSNDDESDTDVNVLNAHIGCCGKEGGGRGGVAQNPTASTVAPTTTTTTPRKYMKL